MAELETAPTPLPEAPGDRPGPQGRTAPELPAGLKAEGVAQPSVAPTEPAVPSDARKEEVGQVAWKEPPPTPIVGDFDSPPEMPITIARLVPKLKKSAKLFAEGKQYVPNASSSLIRVASYDPCPPFIARGKGARIWDEDENEYLDFNLAYGCLINGHAPPDQVRAIVEQAEKGLHFAAPTELEIDVAKLFRRLVPNAERVAFCSNGSDATMNAIRIARAVTGKDAILKFEGHYHGQHDDRRRLGEYPRPLPNSAGIPPGVTDYVMVAQYNSIVSFERMVKRYRDRLACVILEPIMANAGVIAPVPDYLKRIVEIAHQNEILVIFDEVFTGFRVAPGGAQQLYGVEPDLSCWAKALGGGVPISAVSGKAEYMDSIAPGRISFGGTYFANSISLAGTLANLKHLARGGEELYARFGHLTQKLEKGIEQAARDAKVSVLVQSVNGMLQYFFTRRKKIQNYREALQIDWNLYLRNHQLLLDKGIYTHPDNYERITFSSAHTDKDVERFIQTIGETFVELKTLPRDYLA